MKSLLCLFVAIFASSAQAADFLSQQAFVYQASQPERPLVLTAQNLHELLERFVPATDDSSTIVRPPQVLGSASEPVLTLSLRKCVLFICQVIDLRGENHISRGTGSCAENLTLTVDLSHSSRVLADVYRSLQVDICFDPISTDQARIQTRAWAVPASSYQKGPIQAVALQVLREQAPPMTQALRETLTHFGSQILSYR